MAYVHSKYEVFLYAEGAVSYEVDTKNDSGDLGSWGPHYVPHYVRAFMASVTTATVGTASVIALDKLSGATRTDDVAKLTIPALAAGETVYVDGLNILLNPGETVIAEMDTQQQTSGEVTLALYVEPSWEVPANESHMHKSA